jgi:hypothetical protein
LKGPNGPVELAIPRSLLRGLPLEGIRLRLL